MAKEVREAPAIEANQDLVTGTVPLIPAQYRFLIERKTPDPHHWNVSELFKIQNGLKPSLVEQVVQKLLSHHDALRMRFVQKELGWE